MLLHPTLEKLTSLRFTGMAAALQEQMNIRKYGVRKYGVRLPSC